MSAMLSRERIIEEFETIYDPELAIDIWTLGLIYSFSQESADHLQITMTYTTPTCPYGPQINKEIEDSFHAIGIKYVEIDLTFDPPWKPPANLREMLGI